MHTDLARIFFKILGLGLYLELGNIRKSQPFWFLPPAHALSERNHLLCTWYPVWSVGLDAKLSLLAEVYKALEKTTWQEKTSPQAVTLVSQSTWTGDRYFIILQRNLQQLLNFLVFTRFTKKNLSEPQICKRHSDFPVLAQESICMHLPPYSGAQVLSLYN